MPAPSQPQTPIAAFPPAGPPAYAQYPTYPQYPTPYGQPYAPPYGAPYPQQYAPGYLIAPLLPPPGKDTFSGLKFLKYGVGLMVVFNVFVLLSNLLLYGALSQLQAGITNLSLSTLQSAEASLNIALVMAAIAFIFGLIAMIVGFVGVGFLAKGKAEFGPGHARAVSTGVVFTVIASVVFLAGSLSNLTTNGGVQGALSSADISDFPAAIEGMLGGLILSSFIGLAGVVAAYFAMTSLVQAIMTRAGRAGRGVFLGLSVTGPILVLIMALLLPGMYDAIFASMPVGGGLPMGQLASLSAMLAPLKWLALVPALAGFLALLALGVYNRMLGSAGEGARNMIASGLFDPDASTRAPGPAIFAAPAAAYGPQPPQ